MQTQNLSSVSLRGYGNVVPDAAERKNALSRQTILVESSAPVGCYETDAPWILEYESGMPLLVLYSGADPQQAQTFYLDRTVCLHPGVRFSIIPLRDRCAVNLYRPGDAPAAPVETIGVSLLHTCLPQIECEELYTFFYQESAHDFYFHGERHEPYEMVYVDKGSLHNVVNGQDCLLAQQELMFIGSNDWHIQYADHSVSFLTLSFSMKTAVPSCLINRRLPLNAAMLELVGQMLRERSAQHPYSYDYLESLLRILLIELARAAQADEQARPAKPSLPSTACAENQIVDAALQIISQRIREKLSLEELADAVHVSVSYLHRVFNSHLGMPPGKYIARIRLEECKALLREGKLSMGDLAKTMGFSSAQHFSKQFRQCLGITPTEYVKSLR